MFLVLYSCFCLFITSIIYKLSFREFPISHKKSYSIIKVAKLFTNKIKFLPKRKGERYASALSDMNLSNKVYKLFGKKDLISYINNFKKNIF